MRISHTQLTLLSLFIIGLSLHLVCFAYTFLIETIYVEDLKTLAVSVLVIYSVPIGVIAGGIFGDTKNPTAQARTFSFWTAVILSLLWNLLLLIRSFLFALAGQDSVVYLLEYLDDITAASTFLISYALAYYFAYSQSDKVKKFSTLSSTHSRTSPMSISHTQLTLLSLCIIGLLLHLVCFAYTFLIETIYVEDLKTLAVSVLVIYSVPIGVIAGGIFGGIENPTAQARMFPFWTAVTISLLWNLLLLIRSTLFALAEHDSIVSLLEYLDAASAASTFLICAALAYFFANPSVKSRAKAKQTAHYKSEGPANVGQWFEAFKRLHVAKWLRPITLTGVGLLCIYGSITLARMGISAMESPQRNLRSQPCLTKPEQSPEMVLITGGTFMMGSDESKDEQPVHQVTIQDFAMGRCEITLEEYDRFAKATDRQLPDAAGWGRGQRPVINVSWEDARSYADWLSQQTRKTYRLPSEAEWEYAARAGSLTDYPWGDKASHEQANYGTDECCNGKKEGRDQWEFTAPVGKFPTNRFGLYDMHGNVMEWVEDCWHENYLDAPVDASAWLEDNGGNCERRGVRGGSWLYDPWGLRSANRSRYQPTNRDFYLGFRLVQDLK